MTSHAHILDTAHDESYARELASQQLLSGPITQTRTIDDRDRRVVSRSWRTTTPGVLRFIEKHYDENHASAFTVTLRTGETITVVYRQGPQITTNRAGYGSCSVTLEQVTIWD